MKQTAIMVKRAEANAQGNCADCATIGRIRKGIAKHFVTWYCAEHEQPEIVCFEVHNRDSLTRRAGR